MYLENLECECEVPFRPVDLYRQQMRWAYGVISALKDHLVSTLKTRTISVGAKFCLLITAVGYLLTLTLQAMFLVGILKLSGIFLFPPQGLLRLLSETFVYFLLTIGPLLTGAIVLYLNQRLNNLFKLIVSSVSIGIITLHYVNAGIFKALLNKPMQWFLVAKSSNEILKKF